jgi:hypothetical protein
MEKSFIIKMNDIFIVYNLMLRKLIGTEGAQLTPRGKRAPGAEINQYSLFRRESYKRALKQKLNCFFKRNIGLSDQCLLKIEKKSELNDRLREISL